MLTEQAAARWIGVSLRTLQSWRRRGVGPPVVSIPGGRLYRYRRSTLDAWLEEREREKARRERREQ
jgi:excisionase family DNA binding protein